MICLCNRVAVASLFTLSAALLQTSPFRLEAAVVPSMTETNATAPDSATTAPPSFATVPWKTCVNTVEGLYERARHFVSRYPQLAILEDIGNSWQRTQNPDTGYPIKVLRLGKTRPAQIGSASPEPQCLDSTQVPIFFILAGLHGHELLSSQTAMEFADYLLRNYASNDEIQMILDDHQIDIILVGNPDGRHTTESSDPVNQYYRKNVNNDVPCNVTGSVYHFLRTGVDLNRNFDFGWSNASFYSVQRRGAASSCSIYYPGESAASEPETQAIQNYLVQRLGRSVFEYSEATQHLYIDLHTAGEELIYPYGHTTEPAPAHVFLTGLARKLASQADTYTFRGSSSFISPRDAHGGISTSYVYGRLKIPALTLEVTTSPYHDVVTCSKYKSKELARAINILLYAAKVSRKPFDYYQGPEVYSLAVNGNTLSGEVYENVRGITAAAVDIVHYYIDNPPWSTEAMPRVVSIEDTLTNGSIRTRFSQQLDSSGLEPDSTHKVYIQAQSLGVPGVPSMIRWTVQADNQPME